MVLQDGNKGGRDACTEIRFRSLSQIKSLPLSRRLDKPFSSGYNTEKSLQTVSLQISATGSGKGTSSWNQKPNNICS